MLITQIFISDLPFVKYADLFDYSQSKSLGFGRFIDFKKPFKEF
jgi:hypothetical protein